MRYGLKTLMAIALAVPLRLEAQVTPQRIESTGQLGPPSFKAPSFVQQVAARPQFWNAAPASIGGSALGLLVGAPIGLGLRKSTGCCFDGGDDSIASTPIYRWWDSCSDSAWARARQRRWLEHAARSIAFGRVRRCAPSARRQTLHVRSRLRAQVGAIVFRQRSHVRRQQSRRQGKL